MLIPKGTRGYITNVYIYLTRFYTFQPDTDWIPLYSSQTDILHFCSQECFQLRLGLRTDYLVHFCALVFFIKIFPMRYLN